MTKTLKKVLFLSVVLTFVFALAGCGKPELDFDDAKDNLEDKEYVVSLIEDNDLLEPGVAKQFSAYKSNGEGDREVLYMVEYEDAKSAKLAYKMYKLQLEQEEEALKLEIKILENQLKKYEDELKSEEIDDLEDEIKELEDELEDLKEAYIFGKNGKIIWYGTEKAVEDSKE